MQAPVMTVFMHMVVWGLVSKLVFIEIQGDTHWVIELY